MAKLGYTWYPKDWKTNEKVFNLTLEMRGFYRELIDYAYENDNRFTINKRFFCRMMNINTRRFDILIARLYQDNLIVRVDGIWNIPTVEPRIQLIRGGSRGGKKSKPIPKPNIKPDSNQIEIEIEIEREIESKNSKNLLFLEDIFNCFEKCLDYFPAYLHPKPGKNLQNWLDTIEKLNRIDKIPFEKIIEIVKKTRTDDFWSKNFLSIPKLRQKNKEGIKYIVVFNEAIKASNKHLSPMETILNHLGKSELPKEYPPQ